MPPEMHWRNRGKRNDQEHHEKASFFSTSWVLEWFFLFCFWENVFLTSYVGCYLIYSCRKTFKQPLTDVFQNFTIFTGKHLCWSLFLITLQELRPAFLLKRDSNTGEIFTFSCEHFKTFKNSFFIEHLFTVFFRNFMWW